MLVKTIVKTSVNNSFSICSKVSKKFAWKEKLSGQMDISHTVLEIFLRKQLKNIYKIKDKAYIHYPKG